MSKKELSDEELSARHAEKMKKKKAARDKIMAGKTIEKGLLIVHTGKGKGKTTAAMGMVCRALGHGQKVGLVQFVKGAMKTGEVKVFEAFSDQIDIEILGQGFTWDTQDRAADIEAARKAWDVAKRMILDPAYDMVLCDELNIVLRYDYLPLDEVLDVLRNRPEGKHVIVTGRNAKEELIELADLVTEMTEIRHPFRAGVKAQAGVEF
jgi:cob(I)alamin adenosyltransferase